MEEKAFEFDRVLLMSVLLLAAVGTVMLYSASSAIAFERFGDSAYYLKKHAFRLVLGLTLMCALMRIDYRHFRKFAPVILLGALVIVTATLLLHRLGGGRGPGRWLHLAGFSFQTAELLKFALIVYVARFLEKKQQALDDFTHGLLPPVIVLSLGVGLIMLQPDFSTGAMIGMIVFIIFFVGRARLHHMLAIGSVAGFVMLLAVFNTSYQLARLRYFFSPAVDSQAAGYQVQHSLISLGSGGLFGAGLGESVEKNLFLPTPHTDFILAIIGEELGFVGVFVIGFLFLVVMFRGMKIAGGAPDLFGLLLAVGLSSATFLYAMVSAGVVSGLLPTTGLPMPFLSYGGSMVIFSLGSAGILLNISAARGRTSRKAPARWVRG